MRIQFEKRIAQSRLSSFLIPVASFLLALLFSALILILFGINPLQAYSVMVKGSLGSTYALTETLVKSIPLMLTGLGVSIAFQMHFWNIGAEGQLAMGGIAAAFVALFLNNVIPPSLLLPFMFLAGGISWSDLGIDTCRVKSDHRCE